MLSFFEKVGRFFVNLMVVGLILLVSVQILMGNENFQNRFEMAENFINNIFDQPEQQLARVTYEEETSRDRTTGILRLSIISRTSAPEVWLRQNGQRVSNFADGEVIIEAEDDDLITVDLTQYERTLWFEVTSISPEITSFQNGEQFRISGGQLENLGIVRIEDGRL